MILLLLFQQQFQKEWIFSAASVFCSSLWRNFNCVSTFYLSLCKVKSKGNYLGIRNPCIPPSIPNAVPVIALCIGLAKNAIELAISSEVTKRPEG